MENDVKDQLREGVTRALSRLVTEDGQLFDLHRDRIQLRLSGSFIRCA